MDSNIRPETMERISTPALANAFIDEQVKAIREQVGDQKVLLALSGGVDSSVVAALLIKAVGKQLYCVHVNHGLMRKGEPALVTSTFREALGMELICVDAQQRILKRLDGIVSPAAKREVVEQEVMAVFEEEAHALEGIVCLALGTLYPDVLSGAPRRCAGSWARRERTRLSPSSWTPARNGFPCSGA